MQLFKTNIQSMIYEFFTSKAPVCYEFRSEDLGLLQHTAALDSKGLGFYEYGAQTPTQDRPKIILCSSQEAYECFQALSFVLNKKHLKHHPDAQSLPKTKLPLLLPDIGARPLDSMQSYYEEYRELFAKLSLWYENDCSQILISPPKTLASFLPSKDLLRSQTLRRGDDLASLPFMADCGDFKGGALEKLLEKLFHFGYEAVEIVEMQGEFSRRGDILDIFIPNTDLPVRLSFFDTEIESIRFFDCQTQLCRPEELDSITIYPALFSLSEREYGILEAKISALDSVDSVHKKVSSLGVWFLGEVGGQNLLSSHATIFSLEGLREYKENLEYLDSRFQPPGLSSLKVLPPPTSFKDMEDVRLSNIESTLRLHKHKSLSILSPTNALAKSLELDSMDYAKVIITPYYLNIQSDKEIFIGLQRPQRRRKRRVQLALDSLKAGDFVVHSEYGIGVFKEMQQVSILGGLKDFLSIAYANDDRLLLPVENLNLIEKYTGFDKSPVKLDRLGKASFARLKSAIKEKLLEIANEIVRLQAQRELIEGVRLSLDSPSHLTAYKRFEEMRGFQLTKDQDLAIRDSLRDLASGRVMDRLLNGDVGFGKTEVAMSLCFVGALNGFVSLVLVPTTLLSAQHFESFKLRMQGLHLDNGKPIGIARLDRLSSAKERERLQRGLEEGEIHIVIGTQALFNLEIQNLGLIVIDEEHRFGVKQKEILKQKALNTHLLSMSATPIPRTLNMAYSKLKALSHLNTPPFYKQESRTFVKLKQDSLIKEVILRELRRGGQAFYIYNNIAKMPNIKSYLLGLLPNLRILLLHSKINPKETEKGLIGFLKKEYDLMLCTSIVESGIHLPNANTIIIDEAEHFGIADLHQLRGRVGRGRVVGFCYLLVEGQLSEEAQKRLLALEKNSYLGSGANLAMQDLEIRGGGNLLGEAQSGHIKQVGFGLYVRMLEETLQSLLQSKSHDSKVDLKLSVSAFLSHDLIKSERLRLELYRRLSQVKSEQEVREIEGEIEERFGKLDSYSLQFLDLIAIKVLASKLQIRAISNMGANISLLYHDETRLSLKSPTRDDDDILLTIKEHLRSMCRA